MAVAGRAKEGKKLYLEATQPIETLIEDLLSRMTLEEYTLEKIKTDIETAEMEITKLLSVTTKTFAYPCGQKFVGRDTGLQSNVPVIADKFIAGRGGLMKTAMIRFL